MTYQNNRGYRQERGGGEPRRNQPGAGDSLASEKNLVSSLKALRDLEPGDLVALGEKAGRLFGEHGITRSQIRRIHEHIIRQETKARTNGGNSAREILLLKYHLAYATGRERKLAPLADFLNPAFDKIKNVEDLQRFRQLYEAILAYHSFYGR